MTFAEIEKKAAKLGCRHNTLGYALMHILGSSYDNAADTIVVEKAADEAEFDALALSSLAFILGDCRDKKVCAWFRSIGFAW